MSGIRDQTASEPLRPKGWRGFGPHEDSPHWAVLQLA
jgi:hypothetical protein